MGWARTISFGCYPRQSLDQPTPEVWPPDNRSTEGDLGCRSVWSTLYSCPDQHLTSKEVVLPRFFRCSVSFGKTYTCLYLTVRSRSTLGYAAFFITICVHTPYAEPWIFPCIAFYGFDLLFRMLRARVKDAVLIPVGDHMTLVRVGSSPSPGNQLTLRLDQCPRLRPRLACRSTRPPKSVL